VLDALAAAGGFTEFAHRDRIFVLRRQPALVRIPLHLRGLSRGHGRAIAIALQPGDGRRRRVMLAVTASLGLIGCLGDSIRLECQCGDPDAAIDEPGGPPCRLGRSSTCTRKSDFPRRARTGWPR